jgi:hypothetical protein
LAIAFAPGKMPEANAIKKSKTQKHHTIGGLIWPRFIWRYYAANPLAPFGRDSGGAITPRMKWLHMAAN